MKILQIAPLWESVPPPAYGGTEAVVHLLVEELVRSGHQVTLCASGDSQTSALLQACYPRSLRTADDLECKELYSWQHSALSMANASEYDIIHNHAGEEVMALSHLVPGVPMLTTMHNLITTDARFVWDRYQGYYNTVSSASARAMPAVRGGRFAGVVYHAVDVDSFTFQAEKEDYLLFLSRVSQDKGPHLAVEVARRTGRRLVIAGKVGELDYDFFLSTIAPLIDGDRVIFAGEADSAQKRELYRKARAVVLPIMWDEPFGLVMAEAQACGTPVLAFNRGAAPEIIRHGETGMLAENLDELVEAVGRLDEVDPWACRRHVKECFDGPVMAAGYVQMYESILRYERKRVDGAEITMGAQRADKRVASAQVA